MSRTRTRPSAAAAAAALAFLSVPLAAQHREEQPATAPQSIVATAKAAGSFTVLLQAATAAGLAETLSGPGPFTVFAPTDDAFAKLPKGTLEQLLRPESRDRLAAILTYHVVAGRVAAKDTIGARGVATVNGQQLPVDATLRSLRVGDARVVRTDIDCSNGVIHVIDEVLLPTADPIPAIAAAAGKGKDQDARFSTLLAAVDAAGLGATLSGPGPFTVFAPTDDAFARLPKGTLEQLLQPQNKDRLVEILKLHVVAGRVFGRDAIAAGRAATLGGQSVPISYGADGARVGTARLLRTDVNASNGVIHVIDEVLLPERLSRADAERVLQDAVARGSALFNGGSADQCARLYADTCLRVAAAAGDDVEPGVREVLRLTVAAADGECDSRQRAWRLRHGIDLAWRALQRAPAAHVSAARH